MSVNVAHTPNTHNTYSQEPAVNETFDDKSHRIGFGMVQEILYSLPLSLVEFKLYAFFRNVAGDNRHCYMSNETLAIRTGLSVKSIKTAKKNLSTPMVELNGRALIRVQPQYSKKGKRKSDDVTLIDIWDLNRKHITSQKIVPIDDIQNKIDGVNFFTESDGRGVKFTHNQDSSSSLNKTLYKEKQEQRPAACCCSPSVNLPKDKSPPKPKIRRCDPKDIAHLVEDGHLTPFMADTLTYEADALQIQLAIENKIDFESRGGKIHILMAWMRACIKNIYLPSEKAPRKYPRLNSYEERERELKNRRHAAIDQVNKKLSHIRRKIDGSQWYIGWIDGIFTAYDDIGNQHQLNVWEMEPNDFLKSITELIKQIQKELRTND